MRKVGKVICRGLFGSSARFADLALSLRSATSDSVVWFDGVGDSGFCSDFSNVVALAFGVAGSEPKSIKSSSSSSSPIAKLSTSS